MRSPFPTRRSNPLAALLVIAVLLIGSGAGQAGTAVANAAPDAVLAGPQGTKGQFVVECLLDHLGADDPIVHPGHAGMSHLHQFFGAVGVDADSSAGKLAIGDTTCDQHADTAAYWAPVLLAGGTTPIRRFARLRTTAPGPVSRRRTSPTIRPG